MLCLVIWTIYAYRRRRGELRALREAAEAAAIDGGGLCSTGAGLGRQGSIANEGIMIGSNASAVPLLHPGQVGGYTGQDERAAAAGGGGRR